MVAELGTMLEYTFVDLPELVTDNGAAGGGGRAGRWGGGGRGLGRRGPRAAAAAAPRAAGAKSLRCGGPRQLRRAHRLGRKQAALASRGPRAAHAPHSTLPL
jgi:hypothetical protein